MHTCMHTYSQNKVTVPSAKRDYTVNLAPPVTEPRSADFVYSGTPNGMHVCVCICMYACIYVCISMTEQ